VWYLSSQPAAMDGITTMGDIASDLQRHTLEIDCFELFLAQRASENPVSFKGKGYVWQSAEDKLECKIFVEETKNTDQWKWTLGAASGKPGKLFCDSDYFDLTARDDHGVTWKAERLLPRCIWRFDEPCPIVSASIDLLSSECSSLEEGQWVSLHFFGDIELPVMIDKFDFSHGAYEFKIRKLKNSFTVEANSKCALPDDFDGRIQEALRFILAKTVSWRVLSVSSGKRRSLRLASANAKSHSTRLYPPIGRGKSHAYIEECWKMFSLYLDHVIDNS
jgi:hypothetical protein